MTADSNGLHPTFRIALGDAALAVETAGTGPPLVLLHGFTGSAGTWARHVPALAAERFVVAIDLLGHRRSDAPADPGRYAIERAAGDVVAVLDALSLPRAAVLGYSMGGRLALYLAATAPERVAALVLESASPGLAGAADRHARIAQDEALADAIERDGVRAFVDQWERQPLFATQQRLPAADRTALRDQRLAQSPRGLANSLRGMGAGTQPYLAGRLGALPMPVLLIAGALDEKYRALAVEMQRSVPRGRLVVVPDAGHAVHLERPNAFRKAVLTFLADAGAAAGGGAADSSAKIRS